MLERERELIENIPSLMFEEENKMKKKNKIFI